MENTTQTTETTPNPAPKPRSEAQIAASRANGAKSKGPVTEEGKARAALNATRHGLLSTLTVAYGERSDSFIRLSATLYDTFDPIDEHERNLVDTMVSAIWRRSRCLSIETAGISHIHAKQRAAGLPPLHPELQGSYDQIFRALVANPAEQHTLDLLHRYEARHTRSYERAVKALFAYRKLCQSNPNPQPEIEPEPPAAPPLPEPAPEPLPATPEPEHKSVPNEPKPPASTAANHRTNQSPKPQNNHPARTNFKKNQRKNKRRK